jgi:acylphosphatase
MAFSRVSTESPRDRDTHSVSGKIARRYIVRGRVQGVGFRSFVEHSVRPIGLSGWVRNLEDGSVEVYAAGTPEQLSQLDDLLWLGPKFSEVRGVNTEEDTIDASVKGFRIR